MEEIEIPSHFLCPISLQLMKDPVTIWTGITYDRDNIERWFFINKNTACPVTKQSITAISTSLHDDHDSDDDDLSVMITPNHTLRRLIQSWCTLHASNGIERIPTPKQPPAVDRAHVTKLLTDAMNSPELRYSCLQRIRAILGSGDFRARKLLEVSGAFRYVTSVVEDSDHDVTSMKEKEEAVCILAQLDAPEDELTANTLVGFLRSGSSETRECAVKLLNSVYSLKDQSQLALANRELFVEIVKLFRDRVSKQAIKYALKLLMELNPWGRNRVKAVEAGAVHALVELLMDGSSGQDCRSTCEHVLVVLDQLCGCAEGRADLVEHGAGLAVVSKKILRVSHVASDRAVKILSLISRYSATAWVVGEMVEVGVVAKLGLVVQVECSAKTKERAKEILRLHSRVWKMFPCFPPHLLSYC